MPNTKLSRYPLHLTPSNGEDPQDGVLDALTDILHEDWVEVCSWDETRNVRRAEEWREYCRDRLRTILHPL